MPSSEVIMSIILGLLMFCSAVALLVEHHGLWACGCFLSAGCIVVIAYGAHKNPDMVPKLS